MGSQDRTLSFPLTNTRSRQIFEYKKDGGDVLMMYDSGAQIPVWCAGEKILRSAYPNAVKTEFISHISGFGKETEDCPVFLIPLFSLADGENEFCIKNLLVAELYKPFIGCHLLLSETMFSKTDTITTRRKKRTLMIAFDNLERPFICTARRRGKELFGVAVWTQE